MKKLLPLLAAFLLALPSFAADAANDLVLSQRNSGNTGNTQRNVPANGAITTQATFRSQLGIAGVADTNAFTGANSFTGIVYTVFTAMPALAVDMTKAGNTYSAAGDVTFTYSNATPAAGVSTIVRITADSTNRTITIPTTWSLARGGNITSLLVPASTVLQVKLQYVSSRWEIIGDPVATTGTGSYVLASGPTIASPLISNLTAGRVPFAGTSGLLTDDADMTFSTDTFTATKIKASNWLTVGSVTASTAIPVAINQAATVTGSTAYGANFAQSLVPIANNNGITGMQIAPVITLGGFTGLTETTLFLGASNSGSGTIATSYILYLAAGSTATARYGIYQGGTEQNVLGGTLTIPTSAKGDATTLAATGAFVDTATGLTFNAQTGTTYTLAISDGYPGNGGVSMNNASANTLTVPTNASVAFPIKTQIVVQQLGAGATTIAAAGGVTINSPGGLLTLAGQYSSAALVKTGTNTWQLMGTLSNTSASSQTIAAGTAYTLTASNADVAFGTTSPVVTLSATGTYLISATIQTQLTGASFAAAQSVSYNLRRTNNTAADLSGTTFSAPLSTVAITTVTDAAPAITISYLYTTSNATDTVGLRGVISATPSLGSVTCSAATINAVWIHP